MAAWSGRNCNFRCINVVFLACFCASQRVQRRKAELTLAQIREKLPNGGADLHQIWHTCANSYGNGYTQTNCPSKTQGGTWKGFTGQTFKSLGKLSNGWTDWHQLWFTSADSSWNRHRLNPSRPSIPQGAFGGIGGHKFKSCQTAALIGTKFGTCRRIRLGMDIG